MKIIETMKRMNVNIHQILSDLSEKSDKLVEDIKRGPEKEREWIGKIKEMVNNIVNGINEDEENGEEGPDSLKFTSQHFPDCLTYIQGGAAKPISCLSSAFPDQERHHLHKKSLKSKRSTLKIKSRPSSRISNQAPTRSSRSSRNATLVAETSEYAGQEEAANSSINRTFVKQNDCSMPMLEKENTPSTPVNIRKSSKMTLEKELFHKKLKVGGSNMLEPPHLVVRTSRFSTGKKVSSSSDTAKLSVYGARISTKTAFEKKARLKASASCKEGTVAENIKKMKDAKIKMIEEKKRLRDEKMERTKEKRLQIETAKTECVKQKIKETNSRSSRAKERSEAKRTRSKDTKGSTASKTSVKVATASTQKPGPKSSKKPRIESSDGEETPARVTATSVAKKATRFESSKVSETPVKGKRFTPISQTPKAAGTPKQRRPTPTYKTPKVTETPAKGKRPTPPFKTPKDTDTPAKGKRPTPPYKTPSVTETPISSKPQEVESSTKRRATPPIKSQPFKVTPTIVRLHASGEATVIKKDSSKKDSLKRLPSSPPSAKGSENAAKKLKSDNSVTQVESSSKKGKGKSKPESYDMTPDRSSFTSYDMSEIVSDDDDDDDASHQKPIPSWAVGLRLRNALIHQFYNPPDTDELFGSYLEPPNLEVIFEVQKKGYHKRTSSAVWNSPGMFK